MVGRGLFLPTIAALAMTAAHAFQVTITNKCSYDIDMAHATLGMQIMNKLPSGQSVVRELLAESPSNVFKSGSGGEATLAEITGGGGKVWFDISIIPTGKKSGPGYCSSLQECKDVTGGVGFNVPMQIIPSKSDGARCVTLTCMADGCADAYQFPKDDTKTHTCPGGTDLEVVFCPGGSGGQTSAPTPPPTPPPTTAAPTPPPTTVAPTPPPTTVAPTPPPTTAAPTPAPTTEEPTPAPTTEEPTPTPTTEEPTPSPTPSPVGTTGLGLERGELGSNSTSSNDSTSSTSNKSGLVIESPESEVASDATSAPASAATQVVIAGTTTTPSSSNTETATTRNAGASSSGGFGAYAATGLCAAAMVAGVAIVAVRKKKKALEDANIKTPRDDRAMTAADAMALLDTPRENITIL